jgi:putative transcriptional regulator
MVQKSKPISKRAIRSDRMLNELLESARDLQEAGFMTMDKFSRVKTLCAQPPAYDHKKVASIRERKAKMSQSVFAAVLNVATSTVQKWESPTSNKQPSGAAAKLLQLIEAKGIEALLL